MTVISPVRPSSSPPSSSLNNATQGSPTSPSDEDWGDFMQGTRCKGEGLCETLASSSTGRELSIRRYENDVVEMDLKRPDIKDLVLSGGGAKGVAFSGAVKALEESGHLDKISNLRGSSAGAITAAVLACGMTHAQIDKLLDDIDLVSLLDSQSKVLGPIQHLSSTIGKGVAKAPGKTGKIGQLLFDLLPRLQSKGRPLEALVRDKSVESILSRFSQAPKDDQRQISEASKACVEQIKTNRYVTFGDLATLSKDMPEIKQLHITGTAMFDGRPQMVVFNASLTPDLDVAHAALISGSLPVVFQSPSEQGLPFQGEGERTSFQDGGIMLNTPVLDLYDIQIPMSAIPERDQLILKFESENGGKKNDSGTLLSRTIDKAIGVDHSARDAQEEKGIVAFKGQTVIVPLKTDGGDFTTLLGGTVNFSMPKEHRNLLQEKLRSKVEEHLKSHDRSETYTFKSIGSALLALDDALFDTVALELNSDQSCEAVISFRQKAQQALTDLKHALDVISKARDKEDPGKKNATLELTPELRAVINALDQLGDTPEKTDWLAKKLNHGNHPDYMELLQAVKRMDAGAPGQKSAVMTKAIEEMSIRDIKIKSENFIREVLFPSLYRVGQPDSNVKLIGEAIIDLREAKTPEDQERAGKRLIDNYISRNSLFSSFVSSTTVEQTRAWLIPAK